MVAPGAHASRSRSRPGRSGAGVAPPVDPASSTRRCSPSRAVEAGPFLGGPGAAELLSDTSTPGRLVLGASRLGQVGGVAGEGVVRPRRVPGPGRRATRRSRFEQAKALDATARRWRSTPGPRRSRSTGDGAVPDARAARATAGRRRSRAPEGNEEEHVDRSELQKAPGRLHHRRDGDGRRDPVDPRRGRRPDRPARRAGGSRRRSCDRRCATCATPSTSTSATATPGCCRSTWAPTATRRSWRTWSKGVDIVGQVDRKARFLRRIPVDPMTGEAEWGMRSYQDDSGLDLLGRRERLRRVLALRGRRPERRPLRGVVTMTTRT